MRTAERQSLEDVWQAAMNSHMRADSDVAAISVEVGQAQAKTGRLTSETEQLVERHETTRQGLVEARNCVPAVEDSLTAA